MAGYVFVHDGVQFAPEGSVSVPDPVEHNKQLERAELAAWETMPDRFLAYIVKRDDGSWHCTTWCGTELGTILIRSHYDQRGFYGARIRMEYVRIRGTNGATYAGRYGHDWRQCVNLRRVKA